ncbi:OmpH family outer membrane protein [Pedobacter insulae]|uniref:Chaperone for outer membrane proteins, Skp family n=1 Tax=Pedobacter insulae TaxID=414048 RepID=A0A1I2ZHJ6_9SPHI|nr:OmpH family outer membrane protein [Pedobacter insulae]SFH37125.1 chaperone for outer membrane proteins, Skp family [Pedobacter insulae]
MKRLNIIMWLANGVILLSLFAYLLIKSDGYAYIETNKVYEGFRMKKGLQQQLESGVQKESERLDSLRMELKMAMLRYENGKDDQLKKAIELKQQELVLREREAKMQYEELADKYDSQIWAQINQYVQEYGKTHGIKIILGANGNGAVMYGTDDKNITEEIITYINKKHEGL